MPPVSSQLVNLRVNFVILGSVPLKLTGVNGPVGDLVFTGFLDLIGHVSSDLQRVLMCSSFGLLWFHQKRCVRSSVSFSRFWCFLTEQTEAHS